MIFEKIMSGILYYYLTERDHQRVQEQDERIMRLEQELNALRQGQPLNQEPQEEQEKPDKQIGFV